MPRARPQPSPTCSPAAAWTCRASASSFLAGECAAASLALAPSLERSLSTAMHSLRNPQPLPRLPPSPRSGRGYDLVEFVRAGAASVAGLELAPTAQREAEAYIEGQLSQEELARAGVWAADFFRWQHPSGHAFDVGYDYTFMVRGWKGNGQGWCVL